MFCHDICLYTVAPPLLCNFAKGGAAEILYRCQKCCSVAFRGVCGPRGVTVGIRGYAVDSTQFEDKFDTLAHIGRVWVHISFILVFYCIDD